MGGLSTVCWQDIGKAVLSRRAHEGAQGRRRGPRRHEYGLRYGVGSVDGQNSGNLEEEGWTGSRGRPGLIRS